MEIPKIFPVKKSNKQGFSLLEILIVLGILSAVIAFGFPRFKNAKDNIKTIARQVASLSRQIRDQARVKRMTFRLAIKMDEKGSSYWVESANGNILIPSKETLESMQKLDEKERPANPFGKATFFKKDKELPSTLAFGSVETPSMKEAASKGMAYVYYTPEGLVEKAVIQITSTDKTKTPVTWSLIFNPLTGHADIVEKGINLKDLSF